MERSPRTRAARSAAAVCAHVCGRYVTPAAAKSASGYGVELAGPSCEAASVTTTTRCAASGRKQCAPEVPAGQSVVGATNPGRPGPFQWRASDGVKFVGHAVEVSSLARSSDECKGHSPPRRS